MPGAAPPAADVAATPEALSGDGEVPPAARPTAPQPPVTHEALDPQDISRTDP